MTSLRSCAGSRAMADRRPRTARGLALAGAFVVAAAFVAAAALPAPALGSTGRQSPVDRISIADVPGTGGEDCVDDPNAQPGVGLRQCPETVDILSLLPFVAGGFAVLLAIGAGWYLVMRRRAARPFVVDGAPGAGDAHGGDVGGGGAGSTDWWTCSNCGKTNMVGSARCYSCGSWQR